MDYNQLVYNEINSIIYDFITNFDTRNHVKQTHCVTPEPQTAI